MRRSLVPVAALALLLGASCTNSDDTRETASNGSGRTSLPPTQEPTLDWRARPAVSVGGGWDLRGCEGDAPFYCVRDRGRPTGVVELASFPLDSFVSLRGLDRRRALERLAADADRSVQEDRQKGCPPGSRYDSIPLTRVPVAGGEGVRYGFTVTSPRGAPAERSITYATIAGQTVFLTVAAAFGEGSCVGVEGPQFDPGTLQRFEPVLDRLVSGMVLPR